MLLAARSTPPPYALHPERRTPAAALSLWQRPDSKIHRSNSDNRLVCRYTWDIVRCPAKNREFLSVPAAHLCGNADTPPTTRELTAAAAPQLGA